MVDLNQRLDQIRELQGRAPLPSPHIIQGFGEPGDAPSPPLPQNPEPDYILNPEDEPDDEAPPLPSALFPKSPTPVGTAVANVAAPQFSLAVMDRFAGWKGRAVELLPTEEAQVRRVVLQAIQRELDADLAAVAAPRRPRKSRAGQNAFGMPEPVPSEPRKRGRPRKVTA